jgi:predicted Rossmann fold nucleotide-binding protein DprA/Smf involved in DNA uptake
MHKHQRELPSAEVCARIAIAAAGLGGNRHIGKLIQHYDTAVDVVAIAYDNDPYRDLPLEVAQRLRTLGRPAVVAAVLNATTQMDLQLLIPGDLGWPTPRDALGSAAPVLLWASGDAMLLADLPIALTGTARPDPWLRERVLDLATRIADDGWTLATTRRPGIDQLTRDAALAMNGHLVSLAPTATTARDEGEVVVSENPPMLPVVLGTALRVPILLAALGGKVLVAGAEHGSGALRTGIAAHALARPLGVIDESEVPARPDRLRDDFGAPVVQTLTQVERLV